MSNRSFKFQSNDSNSFIPEYMGMNGCIATHSNLSAQTAFMIMNNDNGNAFDAAAGAILVESLVNPQMFSLGGESIMMIKPYNKKVAVLNGNTKSPKNFNFTNLLMQGYREVPDNGIHSSGVPGVFSSIINQAFAPDAAYGGFIGALVTGVKRAVFSNEGGVGSASIAPIILLDKLLEPLYSPRTTSRIV